MKTLVRSGTAIFMFFAFSAALPVGAMDPEFDVITDSDPGFLLTRPKLPWGADPFQKEPGFVQVKSESETYRLGGIIADDSGELAIINGKTVRAGDQVADRWVSEIGDNYVLLKKKGSEVELSIPPLNEREDEE